MGACRVGKAHKEKVANRSIEDVFFDNKISEKHAFAAGTKCIHFGNPTVFDSAILWVFRCHFGTEFGDWIGESVVEKGFRCLLGLGLNVCTLRTCPTNNLNKTIDGVKIDIRRMAFFKANPMSLYQDVHCIPKLYITHTAWVRGIKRALRTKSHLRLGDSKLEF